MLELVEAWRVGLSARSFDRLRMTGITPKSKAIPFKRVVAYQASSNLRITIISAI
jgi:hypothetical protein